MPALPPPLAPQLSPENLVELANARAALRKVRRAISIGNFDASTIALFAALTLLFDFRSVPGVLLGLAMGAAAAIEFRGIRQLRRLEPRATRMLAINQLALALVLVMYAAWRIHQSFVEAKAYVDDLDPDLRRAYTAMIPLPDSPEPWIYGLLGAVALLGQGWLAWYYFTRGKHIKAYLERTPAWIVAMQRADVTL